MNDIVHNAEVFATSAHKGQIRKYNKNSYIVHPRYVASMGVLFEQSDEFIAAAWLHDVVEDCGVTYELLTETFGTRVSHLVREVSHPETPEGTNRAARHQLYMQHYARASSEGKLLKAIDRFANLQESYTDLRKGRLTNADAHFIKSIYVRESQDLYDVIKTDHRNMQTVKYLAEKIIYSILAHGDNKSEKSLWEEVRRLLVMHVPPGKISEQLWEKIHKTG